MRWPRCLSAMPSQTTPPKRTLQATSIWRSSIVVARALGSLIPGVPPAFIRVCAMLHLGNFRGISDPRSHPDEHLRHLNCDS